MLRVMRQGIFLASTWGSEAVSHSADAQQALAATYFDGVSAQPHAVLLQLTPEGLQIQGQGLALRIPLGQVQWPERSRHGKRMAFIRSGGLVQCDDAPAWDAWVAGHGHGESLVVRMQQSWRTVLLSVALLLGLLGATYVKGLPLLADAVVATTPQALDSRLGASALAALDGRLLHPTTLTLAQQQSIQQAWTQTLASWPADQTPPWQLVFRTSAIGPNAFALPGGTLVLTDEMVALLGSDAQVLQGVLAHELGHVYHRHGLHMLVQAGVLGGISALALGDFSSLVAAVPVLLGQAHYSRQAEHQADAFSVQVLRAARISPAVMVTLFEKMQARRGQQPGQAGADSSPLGIAFGSHPADAERIAFFKQAAP